ncbi:meiosis initiator protein [Pelobates fuscus]|uniref:meiosis initiator protein n=1 Tax=Pelobates fuscus TaxID=191477 RepID=UPI002FE48688
MNGCKETEQINSWDDASCGVKHAEDPKNYSEQETEETVSNVLRQTLVPYLSPSSSDNGDTGPWLRSVYLSPGGDLPCSPIMPSTPSNYLGLSPSLFSSPGDHMLQGECSQVLFEEVQLSSCSSPDLQKASPAFTLDHSYQSQSENSSGSGTWKHTQQPQYEIKSEVEGGIRNIQFQNKRKECGEKRRQKEGIPNPSNWANKSFPNTVRCPGKRNKRRPNSLSRLQRLRKKCVNGFIMFCQLNRKLYLSAHPGTASTEATKELAELWREMSALERRPYCIRAYQFSVLHDRLVKKGSSGILHGSL